jgi:hypothetical protein
VSKLIIRDKRETEVAVVDRIANVDTMADNLMATLKDQIEKWRLKGKEATFSEKEVRVLQGLSKTLTEIEAMQRARLKSKELEDFLRNLSDEELAKLMGAKKHT